MSTYSLYKTKIRHRKLLYIFLIIGIALAILCASILAPGASSTKPQQSTSTIQHAKADKTISISSKVLFAGDVNWSRSMRDWSEASQLKEAYPFSGLKGFHRGEYDAWVANLECPTVPGVTPTKNEEQVQLKFNCPSSFIPQLAKWFDIVSLANNHTDNQGYDGLLATRKLLDANNIQYFGQYDPTVLSDICEVVSLPVHETSNTGSKKASLPIAMCGYHGVYRIPPPESIAVMKKYSQYMPVIAYPHMGVEYKPSADSIRTELYHRMVDNGADAVLGNHPHWVQNSEAYKGKLIVYSMGNFIFDQQFSPEVMRSAVITLDLTVENTADPKLVSQWLSIGESCRTYADTCIVQAEKQHLSRLPISLHFGMAAADTSNKLTKPANKDVSDAVAERLQWNNTASHLEPAGTSYVNEPTTQ